MNKIGFDNKKYVEIQSRNIARRVSKFNKLYLEFGGKLFDDEHASRVLPGFEPDSKIKMLLNIKDKVEIVLVINAEDIDRNKMRADLGITYRDDLMRLIDSFESVGLSVRGVVITRYNKQQSADKLRKKLEKAGYRVAYHYSIPNYPNDTDTIISEKGFGKNEYIETTKDIVVVTAPGPGSGKMATCLSQMYHDNLKGIKAGYAKFETFPVWDLPLNHPINLAYEAATIDLDDVNMIDPFYFEAYGKIAVNYNRDVEIFPVLNELLKKILGKQVYKSPTDMGVNMISQCIVNDNACKEASQYEIIRRYYKLLNDVRNDVANEELISKMETIMNKAQCSQESRKSVTACLKLAKDTKLPAAAIELNDGTVITGKTTSLLGASSSCLLNAIKYEAKLPDIYLLNKEVLEPIRKIKTEILYSKNPCLHTDETLTALAIGSKDDDNCLQALNALEKLRNTDMHSSVVLSDVDIKIIRKLGIRLSMEPAHSNKKLFHK